jgi:hypothetical protein
MDSLDGARKMRPLVVAAYCLAAMVLLAAYDITVAFSTLGILHLPTNSPVWLIPQLSTRLIALGGLSCLLLVEMGPDRTKDVLFIVLVLSVVYGLAAALIAAPVTRKALAQAMDKAMETLKSQLTEEQAIRTRSTMYSVGVVTGIILKPVGLAVLAVVSYFIAKAIVKPGPEGGSPQGDE